MKILLNGKPLELETEIDINNLLKATGYKDKIVAVAVNGNFVAREFYDETLVKSNDKIEVVAPMQGG